MQPAGCATSDQSIRSFARQTCRRHRAVEWVAGISGECPGVGCWGEGTSPGWLLEIVTPKPKRDFRIPAPMRRFSTGPRSRFADQICEEWRPGNGLPGRTDRRTCRGEAFPLQTCTGDDRNTQPTPKPSALNEEEMLRPSHGYCSNY